MGAGHGIGIKRNDYHRRNRKRNISMHKHSFGRNVPANSEMALEKAATVPILIPYFEREQLISLAMRDLENQRLADWRKCSTEKACVNYLRHCHSPYEMLTQGYRGRTDVMLLAFQRVSDAIARGYPWLADECSAQWQERNRGVIEVGNGVRIMRRTVRIARRYMSGQLTSQHVLEMNAREHGVIEYRPTEHEPEANFNGALTSLASSRLLYQPPFLKPEEIRARRFTTQYGEMNDRWWEWEEEKGLRIPEREQRFRWNK